jgi:hypothetical protein
LQVPLQRHPARRSLGVAWQPQVQVAPAQDAHEQAFGVVVLFDMTSSFEVVDVLSTRSSVAPAPGRDIERMRRCPCMNWLFCVPAV